jgi:hypothetical protein
MVKEDGVVLQKETAPLFRHSSVFKDKKNHFYSAAMTASTAPTSMEEN